MKTKNHELLAHFDDLSFYRQHFMDVALWMPYVHMICRKKHLACEQVRHGLPGTFPTFIVDDHWVVKFFGRLFSGLESFRAELHAARIVAGCAAIPTPTLVDEGVAFDQDAEWQWPYLVFEFLSGLSLGEVFDQVNRKDLIKIAEEMGSITRALHHLPLTPGPAFPMTWESTLIEMEQLRTVSPVNHRLWQLLPGHLVEQIEAFLVPVTDLVDVRRTPYLINADLTGDHLLGLVENGHWRTLGLIDWGDAWLGGFYYELVALYLYMLHADPQLLQAYLHAYMPESDLLVDFPRRALSATLLHPFNVLNGDLFNQRPELLAARSLEELADKLYGQAF